MTLAKIWMAGMSVAACAFADPQRYSLQERTQPGNIVRVQSALELQGELKVNADGKQVVRVPLTGTGNLLYDEKLLAAGQGPPAETTTPRRTMRYYRAHAATLRVGERDVSSRLRDDRRLIGVEAGTAEVTMYSPLGPLSGDELELIDIQGNSALLGRLLPAEPVAVQDKWTHDDQLAAALLKLDVVTENKLQSVLSRVEAGTAYLELSGTVHGSVAGVASQVEVTAKYNYDLTAQRVVWLAMSLQENREVGHAEPGFEVRARLRVAVNPGEACPELDAAALEPLPQQANPGNTLLEYKSDTAGVQFVHDRNWRIMVDRNDVMILRLIDRGELIAQCNVSRLPDAAAGKQLSMTSFQTDIRRVLDKNFGQFAEARESKNERGLRTLRTIVAGVAADLPIQWIYYHLTDDQGHQASLVFTLDAKLVERFAGADHTLLSGFEFTPGTTPAPAAAKTAAGSQPAPR